MKKITREEAMNWVRLRFPEVTDIRERIRLGSAYIDGINKTIYEEGMS